MNTYSASTAPSSMAGGQGVQSSPPVPSVPGRTLRAGDIGFLAHEAVQTGVDRKHHIKTHEDVGIRVVNVQKKHQFGQLPGVTFNEKSFTSYITTATSLRRTMQQQVSPLRGSSPRKAAGHY
ncbi:hypothetical protein Agub_g12847 [Astrephomene gubernaculifera]|uniref:Uncharacterized protein n=1 Tax=Astrephomene gubernaculifera TaxID=47775 RepID=A0AAD3E1I8_9CHLO|nr:hypothetical protein Agub_g12847 [Astrephomene gubernaculifera]